MFVDKTLNNYLETSSSVRTRSFVTAEWNLNVVENIFTIGNYRYRPSERQLLTPANQSVYAALANIFDPEDSNNFYTGATDADATIDGKYEEQGVPATFVSKKTKEKMLFSLEDCFGKFRPRSGINKLRYFENRYSHHSNPDMASRPRYYMADRNDTFKYWTSYRTEAGVERGISNISVGSQNYIDDAAPFVVYKEPVPANRIVLKMQTHVGSLDLGPFVDSTGSFSDPLFGESNKATPVRWKISVLRNQKWEDVLSFDENSTRDSGLPIIDSDGYFEAQYGLIVPAEYRGVFAKSGKLASASLLPSSAIQGQAWLVGETANSPGIYYIWYDNAYRTFTPEYGWYLGEETISDLTAYATDLTSPQQFLSTQNNETVYKELDYIQGIRVAVDTMNKFDSTFDLIEMSPRLSVDLSDKVMDFSVEKQASDLGVSGMPVGQLLAGTGDIELFDFDQAFSKSNPNSIIKNYLLQNTQIKLYEVIFDDNLTDYYVPVKTMYVESFPESSIEDRMLSLELRDLYFYFESVTAPQIIISDVSLSFAISTLLDSIGFSNYTFKRVSGESDPVIPYFFIAPDKTVAEVLSDLAISTQHTMFFDEYNNFVVMSKNYILPSASERATDKVLYGSDAPNNKQPSIIEVSSKENKVYNAGTIAYTSRYIQRSYNSLRQASLIDRDRSWTYKPVLLWEVAPNEYVRSRNDQSGTQSSYSLAAIPINSDLSDVVPNVVNGIVQNNVIDFGEGVYWLSRYNGYFYANGEIIKYDAVQYSIPGLTSSDADEASNLVWISSVQEYKRYFAKIPFNGKMYPTGLVRIYSEPNYEEIEGVTRLKDGQVAKHGRGQFGTTAVYHNAGLSSYWSNNENVQGCTMDSSYLFTNSEFDGQLNIETAGASQTLARQTSRNGIIANFFSSSFVRESDVRSLYSTQSGTVQSSALVMSGRSFLPTENPLNFISYVHKPLDQKFKHFGTRMRIVGKINNNDNRIQSPSGSSTYYTISETNPEENTSVGGSSGGLAVMVNPSTNVGYYFEIVALTENSVEKYAESENIYNVIFYKILNDPATNTAIPVRLWGGLSRILVDSGDFVGQYRMSGEENPTVYDLSVEYENIGGVGSEGADGKRRFYLYINNKLVQVVDDDSPLPEYPNMGLFVRGSARCMFENIYALGANYSQNTSAILDAPAQKIFSNNEINLSESFRKYAMSGVVQSTYLSGVSPSQPPEYNMYFEEFGTIMREASYFDIRYDKAYPALYAKLSPTFNRIKGYTVSGFTAGAYGAEFLIFNATDTAINLDETSGNYLRIQGVTFTQSSDNELTVDDYFEKVGNLSDPDIQGSTLVTSTVKRSKEYEDIRNSRITQGIKEFNLKAPYIQSQDDASEMMSWIIDKISKPRASVGLEIFADPTIQLGDIVKIYYKDKNNVDQVAAEETRFVVYNIEYSRKQDGPSMKVYLSEVF